MTILEKKLKVLGWQGGTVWQADEALNKHYLKELQHMKYWDEVQKIYQDKNDSGYSFIMTAGHGYLVVPSFDHNYQIAVNIAQYGFKGKLAIYLEEDCEAPEFLKAIKSINV